MTKDKTKPLRRSKRLTPEKNARLEKLDIIEEEEEELEQLSFGL